MRGNPADGTLAGTNQANQQARLGIEIQRRQTAARAGPLHHIHQALLSGRRRAGLFRLAGRSLLIVDVHLQAYAQIAEDFLDLRREGEFRVQRSAIQLAARQLVLLEYGERSPQPAFVAIEGADAVAAVRGGREIHDGGALVRKLGEDLHLPAAAESAEAHALAFGGEAFHRGHFVLSADRLIILAEDLVDGKLARLRRQRVVQFLLHGTVDIVECRRGQGTIAAAMAAPARHHLPAAEVALIDGLHHRHHLARPFLKRRVRGPIHGHGAGSDVTLRAVVTERGGHHAHGPQEVVDSDSLKHLDVFELLLRHERFPRCCSHWMALMHGASRGFRRLCSDTQRGSGC